MSMSTRFGCCFLINLFVTSSSTDSAYSIGIPSSHIRERDRACAIARENSRIYSAPQLQLGTVPCIRRLSNHSYIINGISICILLIIDKFRVIMTTDNNLLGSGDQEAQLEEALKVTIQF